VHGYVEQGMKLLKCFTPHEEISQFSVTVIIMAASEIFVNPAEIRNCSNRLVTTADQIKGTLDDLVIKMESTEATYQAQSATDMRDKFNELKPEFEKFDSYLRKIATYLTQNVAEPTEVTDQVASQNVASIKKPQ